MYRLATALILVLFFIGSCTTTQKPVQITDENLISQKPDEEEYDIVVLDPGFESWYDMKWSPARERSLSFYDTWNDRYAQAWNYKATAPGYNRFFTSTINYDPSVNYGLEVSRKLYYYFKYVENKLNIPILDMQGPTTGTF